MGDILVEVDAIEVRRSNLSEVQEILARVKEKRAIMGAEWAGLLMTVERDARLFADGALDLHDLHDLDNLDGLFEARDAELEVKPLASAEPTSPKFKRPIQVKSHVFCSVSRRRRRCWMHWHSRGTILNRSASVVRSSSMRIHRTIPS